MLISLLTCSLYLGYFVLIEGKKCWIAFIFCLCLGVSSSCERVFLYGSELSARTWRSGLQMHGRNGSIHSASWSQSKSWGKTSTVLSVSCVHQCALQTQMSHAEYSESASSMQQLCAEPVPSRVAGCCIPRDALWPSSLELWAEVWYSAEFTRRSGKCMDYNTGPSLIYHHFVLEL